MKLALRLAAPVVVLLLAACSGNVVVDTGVGTGTGTTQGTGAGTTLGTGASTTTNPGAGGSVGISVGVGGSGASGEGGANCFNLPSSASLSLCGGSGSSGGMCDFQYCDTSSNQWEADCTSTACQCLVNGNEICTCALSSPGDICSGTPDCCFHH
jgi:hypothetical protein